jgi:hypothetical protein
MKIEGIKKILWMSSVKFVRDNNTMMIPYTYQSLMGDIFKSAKRRHIIGDLQLFEALFSDGCNEAVFQFSPNYLNREAEMLFSGMGTIKWKLILPEEVDRVGNQALESNFEDIQSEIVEKIAASRVEIMHYKEEMEFDADSFISSLAA